MINTAQHSSLPQRLRTKAMGFRAHILKRIKFRELNAKQKSEMKKRLQQHKKELQAALKAVNQGLTALKKK
jgi:hypothetical protein